MDVALKVVLLALLLLALAFLGLGIKMLFKKNAKFPAGGCSGHKNDLSCNCNDIDECNVKD